MPCILWCFMLFGELATLQKSITLTKEKHVASVVWQSTQYQIVQIFQPCKKKFRRTHTNLIALCEQNFSCSPPPQHSVIIWFDSYHTIILELFNLIPPPHHSVIIQFDSFITLIFWNLIPSSHQYFEIWFLHYQFDSSHQHSVIFQFDSFTTKTFCNYSIWSLHHTKILHLFNPPPHQHSVIIQFDSFVTPVFWNLIPSPH